MTVGMLWFDNDPRTSLAKKVEKAAGYYRQKYGLMPDLCLVHPSALGPELVDLVVELKPGRVIVQPFRGILPGHLWIGPKEKIE
jgi:hypothetical protein